MSQQNNGNGQVQRSGPSTITSPNSDTRTFSHRGTEVGSANVTLEQNAANQNQPVISWSIPRTYTEMVFSGGKHITKAQFRAHETATGDGSTTTFSLSTNFVAVAGEEHFDEQPFPAVVIYDETASNELTWSDIDSVDYMKNEITFSSAPANGNDLHFYPVIGDGEAQYRARDGFGHQVGPLDEWGVPMHVFADYDQEKNQTQLHMIGSGRFIEDEELVLFVDSPSQVVWQHAQYPRGQYVSKIEQRVDVQL